jgi:hypothetical protein
MEGETEEDQSQLPGLAYSDMREHRTWSSLGEPRISFMPGWELLAQEGGDTTVKF